jgi:hypothetical protein
LPEESRGRSRSREPEGPELPTSKRALTQLSDKEWDELTEFLGLEPSDSEEVVWEAIEDRQPADEPPPSRGRGRSSEDEGDTPRRGRGRRDEPEDEPPARGRGRSRSSRDDEPEDEKPSRGRGRGRSRDDEDEKPSRGRGRGSKEEEYDTTRKPSRGFEGFKKTRKETSNFDDFKLTEDETLVKFLDDEPFATYGEHGLFKALNKGQRVWICLKPKDCPVCNTGHDSRAVALWNVLVIPEEGEPKVKVLKAGPMLEELIEKKASLKTGPMTKEYYSLSQTPGKNDGPPQYAVEVVRERDLKADWEEEPFTDDELDDYAKDMQDENYVKYPTLAQMKDIAKQLRERD